MNTPLNDALKPCPFCGSNDIKSLSTSIVSEYLECAKCMTEGPVATTKAEAIAAWNIRADTPDSAAQGAMTALHIQKSWKRQIKDQPVMILYVDSINDEQVCRDDLWLATTSQLAQPSDATAQPMIYAVQLSDGTWCFKERRETLILQGWKDAQIKQLGIIEAAQLRVDLTDEQICRALNEQGMQTHSAGYETIIDGVPAALMLKGTKAIIAAFHALANTAQGKPEQDDPDSINQCCP